MITGSTLLDDCASTSDKLISLAGLGAGMALPGGGYGAGLKAGRRGAFRQAKRQNDIPVSQQPSRVKPNKDKRGKPQPGRQYEFDTPDGKKTKTIRDDAGGHTYPDDPTQNRGPHFNDDAGNHYDY